MKLFIVAALFAMAAAAPAEVYPSKPAYSQEAYAAPAYKPYEQNSDYPAQPYSFSWAVDDQPSYSHFSHSQSSDAKIVSGSYKVLLPDGRTQVVNYKDDGYGYVADVKYEGEASYPEYKPAYNPSYPAKPEYPTKAYDTPAYPAQTVYQTPSVYPEQY